MKTLFLALLISITALAQTVPPHSATVTWQWSQGTGGTGTGFTISRSTTKGGSPPGTYTAVGNTPITVFTFVDTSGVNNMLVEGQQYCYVVVTTGPGGSSPLSNEWCGTIPFLLPVAATGVSGSTK